MVLSTRIELVMTGYQPIVIPFNYKRKIGGGDKDRTCYILLAKQALSQMSYTPNIGSTAWARTRDQMINSHLLYQLSYCGIKLAVCGGIEPP